jgi:hypothetical protein
MELLWPSETSVDFRRTTWRYIPADITFLSKYELRSNQYRNKIASELSVLGIKVLQKQSKVLNATYAAITSSEIHISCPSIIEGMKVV